MSGSLTERSSEGMDTHEASDLEEEQGRVVFVKREGEESR